MEFRVSGYSWLIPAVFAVALAFGGCGGGDDGGFDPGFEVPVEPDITYEDNAPDVIEDKGPAAEEVTADTTDAKDVKPPDKCETDADCELMMTGLESCQKAICDKGTGECHWEWDSGCCLDRVFLEEGFESGMPEGWTIEDIDTDDFITWSVTDHRHAFGGHSVYMGHPKCHTYYSGLLDQDCIKTDPGGLDESLIRVNLLTPEMEFPDVKGTLVAEFYLWMETEPFIEGLDDQPDLLSVKAETADGFVVPLFPETTITKSTNGVFIFVTTSLKGLAGEKVKLKFKFDSLDKNNNDFEGVYLDNVKVFSACGLQVCNTGDVCQPDEEECTDDECQVYWDTNNGYCAYPPVPTCIEPMCTTENVNEKCTDAKECEEASCVDGVCVYTEVPDCCKTWDVLDADFDDASLSGFNVYSYQSNAKVKWQVSNHRSVSGDYSLYYGNTVALNYDTPGTFNFGEATSQVIMLEEGFGFLTFDLFLSTEFDNTDPDKYYNPLGIDFFEVQVIENLGDLVNEEVTVVWTSHNIQGTSAGSFIPVGIDLSEFIGKNIWLRFRFDTSDGVNNDFEGPYIDDVRIEFATPTCPVEVYDGRNCQGDYDCGIDGVCKTGSCVDNKCDVEVIGTPPECCSTQTECNDGDPCTADGCIDHKCEYSDIEGPGCCKPDTLASYDFSLGLNSFSVVDDGTEVKWQTTDAQYHSEPSALYFGNGVDFDNGTVATGSALSPEINIPSVGKFHLSFFLFIDVDTNLIFDQFTVDVVTDDMTPHEVYSKDLIPLDAFIKWFEVSAIDLDDFKGKKIKIRFSFNSIDQIQNDGFGVAVDDVKVEKVCLE